MVCCGVDILGPCLLPTRLSKGNKCFVYHDPAGIFVLPIAEIIGCGVFKSIGATGMVGLGRL
jgi:hypothetical protein